MQRSPDDSPPGQIGPTPSCTLYRLSCECGLCVVTERWSANCPSEMDSPSVSHSDFTCDSVVEAITSMKFPAGRATSAHPAGQSTDDACATDCWHAHSPTHAPAPCESTGLAARRLVASAPQLRSTVGRTASRHLELDNQFTSLLMTSSHGSGCEVLGSAPGSSAARDPVGLSHLSPGMREAPPAVGH
jgi:hypothetical protein